MDAEFSDLFLQDCETPLDFDSVSDAGYYSACDGLSPASSAAEGSSCSSPTWSLPSGPCDWSSSLSHLWRSSPGLEGPETDNNSHRVQLQSLPLLGNQEQTVGFQHPEHQKPAQTGSNIQTIQLQVSALPRLQQQMAEFPLQEQSQTSQQQDGRRSRCRTRYPGRKRHNASEREKLRMRDLTKSLHHLRTYLPASVAPAGQTLTKIQTLRLAIRYIEHLSAQVEASYVDPLVRRTEQQIELCHSQAQTHAQGALHDHSPAQHIHCPPHLPVNHWSQHRHQYTLHSGQHVPFQQNHAIITNSLTSAPQQEMTIYQQQKLVPASHGLCYSPHQL